MASFMTLHFQIMSILTTIIIITDARIDNFPNRRRCYNQDNVCFGVKDGVKSFGDADGCLKDNDCHVQVRGRLNRDKEISWYIMSKWSETFETTDTTFTISKYPLDEGPNSDNNSQFHSFFQRKENNPYLTAFWSRIAFKSGPNQECQLNGCLWPVDQFHNESLTIALFKSKTFLIYVRNGKDYIFNLLLEDFYLHFQFVAWKGGNIVHDFSVSTDDAIRLFEDKNHLKPGWTPSTTISTTGRPPSVETPTKSTFENVSTQTPTLNETPKVKSGNLSTIYIVIIAVSILILIITAVLIYTTCYMKKKNEKKMKKVGVQTQKARIEKKN